jgi:ribosomal protein S18 acetylase RimI-like enzyme
MRFTEILPTRDIKKTRSKQIEERSYSVNGGAKSMKETVDDVLVRDFSKSDLDDLLEVLGLSFSEELEVSGFDPDRAKKMVDQMFGIIGRVFLGFSKLFGKEFVKFLVAEVDQRLVGTAMVNNRGKVGYISTVMVHPNYRRQGVARKLMKNALDYIQKKKMKKAVLHVVSKNVSAKNLYTELGFRKFEKTAHLVGSIDCFSQAENVEGARIRNFEKNDTDAVYALMKSSEDPKNLEIFDFKKEDLKTPFVQRMFHFSTESKIVALHDESVIGYAQAICTTPNEAGRIRNIQVCPEMRSMGIEEMLINAAVNEIRKVGTKKVTATASLKRPELIAAMKRMGFKKHLEMEGMVLEVFSS